MTDKITTFETTLRWHDPLETSPEPSKEILLKTKHGFYVGVRIGHSFYHFVNTNCYGITNVQYWAELPEF